MGNQVLHVCFIMSWWLSTRLQCLALDLFLSPCQRILEQSSNDFASHELMDSLPKDKINYFVQLQPFVGRMTTSEKRQSWILDEILIRGQLDYGSHPERYINYSRKRTKPFKIYKVRPDNPTILPSMSTVKSAKKYYTQEPTVPYHRITNAELRRELDQIFHIRARLIDAFARMKRPNPQLWLRSGWRGFYYPVGYRYPKTPKVRRVPLSYLTPFQQRVKNKWLASNKWHPLFSVENFMPTFRWLHYWFYELFPPIYHYPPYTLARVSDFNEDGVVDPSRKHYNFPKDRPNRKLHVPCMYDDSTHCILAKYLNLRKYHLAHADGYLFKPTYLMDKRIFTHWTSKSIQMLRRHFEVHDPSLTGFVTFDDMCKILIVFGITFRPNAWKREFNVFVNSGFESPLAPRDQIEFEEFLRVFYILKYKVAVPDPEKPPIRLQLGLRRNTPIKLMGSRKPKKNLDIRYLPASFRRGAQGISIAVGSSLQWNFASGMY